MYLGLDLGTSGLKALIIDEHQNTVASANSALQVSRPHSGWSEQDPASWITAAEQALDALKVSHPTELAAVRGIGFSGQMHGATLLDSSDAVLRPCMLWNDTRSHKQASVLDGKEEFRALSGNIVFPGFTAPKVDWVRQREPELFARIAKILLPKDYLRFWLTGDHVSEMSDAAGTSWLDVAKREWSDTLLSACELNQSQMPRLVEGTEISGQLRSSLAARWGMDRVAIAGGAGDNAASAVGLGVVTPGSAFVSLGTSGVLFAANGSYLPNPESAVHTFCHALPDTWHQMGVFLSATDSLNWWANVCGSSAAELTAELGDNLQTPGEISFLPYLSGERTPHNDAAIRGAFIGLDHGHDRQAMTRAVLEGVAFALRDSLEALAEAGTSLDRVMAVGGGTRSPYWLDAVANALDWPLDLPQDGDFGAAFGAARLGLIAAEGTDPADICCAPEIDRSYVPDPGMKDAFEAGYQRYRALYPALAERAG